MKELGTKNRNLFNLIRHVPVINQQKTLINLITESQLIEFIFNNIRFLGNIKNKPLHTILEIFKKLQIVKKSDLTINAFKWILEKVFSETI